MHRNLPVVVSILFLALCSFASGADQLVETKVSKAPDARKRIETKIWESMRTDVALTQGKRKSLQITIPPEKEARYVKVSWSPSSDAALVGVNCKAVEDWILIRVSDGKASSTYFDGDKLVMRKMLAQLPFRKEIASSAPVVRVPWKTVRWRGHKRCEMTFLFHGIGYEGTARLRIDFRRKEPRFTIVSIEPTVDPKLWNQD